MIAKNEYDSLFNSSKNRRYVFTPMLSGLRWPGQTVMGSWPRANVRVLEKKKFYICSDVTHTHPACSGV